MLPRPPQEGREKTKILYDHHVVRPTSLDSREPRCGSVHMQQATAQEMSIDNLMGADVYGAQDDNIGSINDVVMGQDGQAEYVVVDVGGFLGLGAHSVAPGMDEVQVLREDDDTLRVYVDATQEQLENAPEYQGQN
jgi:hypothetical protein